jgi:hypothetical protein
VIRCAIEGCTAQTGRYETTWICSTHWRKHCPPRSRRRRAYHAFFRTAKKHGWGYKGPRRNKPRLDWRFHQFWDALVRLANLAEKNGRLDETEINRMFGWTDE